MSEQILSVNLTPKEVVEVESNAWLFMELVKQVDDEITLDQAADLIDTLYDTSICDPSYDIPVCGGTRTEGTPPVIDEEDSTEESGQTAEEAAATEESYGTDPSDSEVIQTAAAIFDLPACDGMFNKPFTVQVRLFRSDITEPYNLVLNVGEIIEDIFVEEVLTLHFDLKQESSITIEKYPIISDWVNLTWMGKVYDENGEIEPLPRTNEPAILLVLGPKSQVI